MRKYQHLHAANYRQTILNVNNTASKAKLPFLTFRLTADCGSSAADTI